MSEFGMQSFPSDEVLRQMMTKEVLSYQDEGMEVHQKHNRGFKLMDKYMQNWYPKVSHDDLSKYAQMTQVVQAEGIAMGIEAQRRQCHDAWVRCIGN
jgi:beta-mannosidase